MKNRFFWISLFSILIFATGCRPKNEFQAPPPPPVTVAKPEVRDVTTFRTFPGRLDANQQVGVQARVRGYLMSVDFQAGEMVEQGDLLFQIDPSEYQAAVEAAKASLAQAQAAAALGESTYQKQEELYVRDAISQLDLEVAKAERDASQAAVLQAEATLLSAQINLDFTTISSPISGRVSREAVTQGNLVGSGQGRVLTTVVNVDPIYVYFNVSERILLALQREYPSRTERGGDPNAKVFLEMADGGRQDVDGVVDFVDNRVDQSTGTIEIRAIFPNPELTMLPGQFANVLLPLENPDSIIVPERAIQRDLAGTFVMSVGANNVVEANYVELGEQIGAERIILEGLDPEELIIVDGLTRARPGSPVTPVPADAPATE